MGLMALMATFVFALSSFSTAVNSGSEQSCKVTVKYQNGDPAKYVTVTAGYGGIAGGQHDFKTDGDGVVTLTWDMHEIKCLWVKGNKYEVDYRDGKSYTLTLKQKHEYD